MDPVVSITKSFIQPVKVAQNYPTVRSAFADNTSDSNNMLFEYRKQKLALYGVEAARNPFDVPKSVRDSGDCFGKPVRERESFERINSYVDIEPLRIRRKIMSGSYKNSSVGDEDKLPAVIRYAWKGKIDKLRNYLRYSINHGNINKQDEMKRTALHMAASWADDKMLRVLLSVPGININSMDCDGKTALRKAVEINSLPCVKLLMEHQVDPVLVAKDYRNPFEYALQELGDSAFDIISYMYVKGGIFRHKDAKCGQFTYLHQLCIARRGVSLTKVAEELINQGAFLNATDGIGRTPLILAAARDKSELIRVFVRNNPDFNHVDMKGTTAIDVVGKDTRSFNLLQKAMRRLRCMV